MVIAGFGTLFRCTDSGTDSGYLQFLLGRVVHNDTPPFATLAVVEISSIVWVMTIGLYILQSRGDGIAVGIFDAEGQCSGVTRRTWKLCCDATAVSPSSGRAPPRIAIRIRAGVVTQTRLPSDSVSGPQPQQVFGFRRGVLGSGHVIRACSFLN